MFVFLSIILLCSGLLLDASFFLVILTAVVPQRGQKLPSNLNPQFVQYIVIPPMLLIYKFTAEILQYDYV